MRKTYEQGLWSIFLAVSMGMSLLFMFASSYPLKTRALGGLAGLGFVLLQISLRRRHKKLGQTPDEIIVDEAVILVDGNGSGEIFLGTGRAIVNPRLVIQTAGGRVMVEDAWHEGVSVLSKPTPISHWRNGVTYPGVLSVLRPLKLLVHNESFRPATVRARVYTKRN